MSNSSGRPILLASDLLASPQADSLDFISKWILLLISKFLDSNGAWDWNHRWVGVVAAIILYCIRRGMAKRYGVDWLALTHGVISATCAILCTYLDVFASPILFDTVPSEEVRSCSQCGGPLTSLHQLTPAITMGYGLFDLMDGMLISTDFLLHGIATLSVMVLYGEIGKPQFITPMLLMEASTPFLTLAAATFFTPTLTALNLACFTLAFFLFRIVIVPYLWFQIMTAMFKHYHTDVFQQCFQFHIGSSSSSKQSVVVPAKYFVLFSLLFGIVFHCLNGFWFLKIIKKVKRKLSGVEHVNANNHLTSEHELAKQEKQQKIQKQQQEEEEAMDEPKKLK